MSEECLKKCLNDSEMSKAEDKVVEFFNRAEAVQVDEGTWYYHESSVESELKSLYEQLAKANERVSKLESYNVALANESHEYQQRCFALDEIADTAFKYNHSSAEFIRAWNKLQQLRKEQER